MLTPVILLTGLILAIGVLMLIPKLPSNNLKGGAALLALLVFAAFFCLSSFRHVGENELGIVLKNVGTRSLEPGRIIATGGEKGPQARVLPPGWHPWLWPIIYDVQIHRVIEVPEGKVGLLTASDGLVLPPDTTFAPEWPDELRKRMADDAVFFLTEGKGYKGPQATVLTPGKHRINPKLFTLQMVDATNVAQATVAVVKANVGSMATAASTPIVPVGERGIWREPLLPGKYYLNTSAFEVIEVSTGKQVVRYTRLEPGRRGQPAAEEREITVRSSDGFTFPVDVRIEFEIKPENAPRVVANFKDDGEDMFERLNSAVRAIFRNNAEKVKALDYVRERSNQEEQSHNMLAATMEEVGITVTAVRIGDVGNEETLGTLLKTQTDRELALQEQETFKEQQRAAEQKKQLTRTEQEAEEERRLATAMYQVQIAEADKQKRIIEANAEAESIAIKAEAQSRAYQLVAEQIGRSNAALVELLRIVGEHNITITPRVMVVGGGGNAAGQTPETTALIGTMLNSMVDRSEDGPDARTGGN